MMRNSETFMKAISKTLLRPDYESGFVTLYYKSAKCRIERCDNPYLYLDSLRAKEPNNGHGTELMEQIIQAVRESEQELYLNCMNNNYIWVHGWYINLGFNMTNEIPVTAYYHIRGAVWYVLQKLDTRP